MRNIYSRIDKYEIRIRKAVNGQMHGNFSSIFKGTGLEFADLRTYQYGDDVRAIDWITTAKGHGAYVKIFKEEKEQNVFFVLDVSGSQRIGQKNNQKLDRAKEVCGVLALSALKESSQVGLYCFSDQKELYVKPEQGLKHAYNFISKLFRLETKSEKTDLTHAISFVMNQLKKKSVIILISDFKDDGYQQNLKALAKKHDLVVIHIFDDLEVKLPSLGIIPVRNPESKLIEWVNTSSRFFKKNTQGSFENKRKELESLCKKFNANYIHISPSEDFVPGLVRLFKVRQ